MPKSSILYICQNCGTNHPKWQGQCTGCGEWNSLVEEVMESTQKSGFKVGKKLSSKELAKKVIDFSEVDLTSDSETRLSTNIGELDRVLGGGLVKGSVILLGGEPGIGKSTLLTQLVLKLLFNNGGEKVAKVNKDKKTKKITKSTRQKPKIIYACGEESPSQISLRIRRILKNDHSFSTPGFGKDLLKKYKDSLLFVTSTDVDEITSIVVKEKPTLLIIDSIQTLKTDDLTGASGSVGQVRECSDRLISVVKPLSIPTFLVGHVTKDGVIAGPKILEHMVDTVVELWGERTGQLRLVRSLKNRFGATDEVGVFKIEEYGLSEVSNPSELLLEHQDKAVPGSTTVCILEGTRPLLIEVQALVVNSQLAMPRRVGRGIELSRIQVLAAVLQKHCHLPLGSTDIFLNAAGGFKVKEPAVDLGLAVAIASSLKNKTIPQKILFIGEIGLLGEIRKVPYLDRRVKEAKRLGFKRVISRETNKSITGVLREFGLG